MKIFKINPQTINTPFDNKKREIKKYIEKLDFSQTDTKEKNLLKRVALLLINENESSIVTIDYKNNDIEFKSNEEFLIAAKLLGKDEIFIKVLSNEEQFMVKYQCEEIEINTSASSTGFINWQEKNKISKEDWSNVDFLEEIMELSSFENLMDKLIKTKNDIYLTSDFILRLVKDKDEDIINYYFSILSDEELKSPYLMKVLKDDNEKLLLTYLHKVIEKKLNADKELTQTIKKELINENNIENIIDSKNISKLYQFVGTKLRNNEYFMNCLIENMKGTNYSNDKLNIDQVIKIIGKKYLMDKKNFIFFTNSISYTVCRTNEITDILLNEITAQFDLNNEQDKKYFDFLCERKFHGYEYTFNTTIVKMILKNNKEKLTDKEKLKYYAKGILHLEKESILKITKTEEDIEYLLNNENNSKYNNIVIEKIKTSEDIKKFITKKKNIIAFIRIAMNDNWLKNKLVPEEWKIDNEILIETYGRTNYNTLPLEKRKEIEESKENIKKIINISNDNFNIIRNHNKYDLMILKELAIDNPNNFIEIMESIPLAKWYNFDFALNLIEYHPKSLKHIPEILFDNKQFTLSVFKKYETHASYHISELLSKVPEGLKSFIKENQISNNYIESLDRHFMKENLEINLIIKNDNTKKVKI